MSEDTSLQASLDHSPVDIVRRYPGTDEFVLVRLRDDGTIPPVDTAADHVTSSSVQSAREASHSMGHRSLVHAECYEPA